MKKNLRKFLALFLAVVMCVSLLPFSAFAEEEDSAAFEEADKGEITELLPETPAEDISEETATQEDEPASERQP